jgi:long-chain acyl-CoA synthetase
LTSISCQSKAVEGLLKLKESHKADSIQNLIVWDKIEESLKERAEALGIRVYHIDEVMEAGRKSSHVPQDPKRDTIYMFCYTSGTTGNPKAAMLSHANFVAVATCVNLAGSDFAENDTIISYLPAAHSMEQCLAVGCMTYGVRVGFWSGK